MTTVWIGDFRLKQLQLYQGNLNDSISEYEYLIDDAAEYTWFKSEASMHIPQMYLNRSNIVIMLGFIDCVYSCTWEKSYKISSIADKYVNIINDFVSKYADINFYVCSVNPVKHDYPFAPYKTTGVIEADKLNTRINTFNTKLKASCKANFVDTWSYLTSTNFKTRDCVRYASDTCKALQTFIESHFSTHSGPAVIKTRASKKDAPQLLDPNAAIVDESSLYWMHTSWSTSDGKLKGLNECIEISNGSVLPNCVGYAWGRFYELIGEKPKLSTGNAEMWWGHNDGYERGQEPKVGAVMCWKQGAVGDATPGHVAIVEQVNDDGSIVTSESNYTGESYDPKNTRHFDNINRSSQKDAYGNETWGVPNQIFQGFIYCPKLAPGGTIEKVDKKDVVSKNGYLTQAEMEINAKYIWNYLGSRGWSVNAVAGMLGNMQHESNINPGLWEGGTGPGFGLVQWTPSTDLTDWCAKQQPQLDPNDIDSQLECLIWEKDNGKQYYRNHYDYTFKTFSTSTDDAYTLACAFAFDYERSAVVLYGFHSVSHGLYCGRADEDIACRACYANKYGEDAAEQQAERNREALRKKRGGAAESWYKFLHPYAPSSTFKEKFIFDCLKIDEITASSVKFSFIVNKGNSGSYTIFDKTNNKKKTDRPITFKINDTLNAIAFDYSNLTPNTSYKISVKIKSDIGGDVKTHTINFKTPESLPKLVKNIEFFKNLEANSNSFKLNIIKPEDLGYWKNNSNGYELQLIINGHKVKTINKNSASDKSFSDFDLEKEFGYKCKTGDVIQIGVRTWVTNNNGKKLFDSDCAKTSKPVCLLEKSINAFLNLSKE